MSTKSPANPSSKRSRKGSKAFSDVSGNNEASSKYFITPGLLQSALEFEYHYKASGGEPVMIVGDTGVGKSLFLKMYENLFKNDTGVENNGPVVWANCSHFAGGSSDLNIAKGELFGLDPKIVGKDGAFREGLIPKAHKGVLVLEEIGELPKEVQAMLLTFIETKKFISPKDYKEVSVDCRIVGATNDESKFREDFRYRFFPFYLPALYKRRIDVLYYLFVKYPELKKNITPWEILILLAHNWPGNVRDVLRTGKLIKRQQMLDDELVASDRLAKRTHFYRFDKRYQSFSYNSWEVFTGKLKDNGVEIAKIDKFLKNFGISLGTTWSKLPVNPEKLFDITIDENLTQRFGFDVLQKNEFSKIVDEGLRNFCWYFFSEIDKNSDLFQVDESSILERGHYLFKSGSDIDFEIFSSIVKALFDIDIPSGIAKNISVVHVFCLEKYLENILQLREYDEVLAFEVEKRIRRYSKNNAVNFDFMLSRPVPDEKILECYKKSKYNLKQASGACGLSQVQFRSRLKKIELKEGIVFERLPRGRPKKK